MAICQLDELIPVDTPLGPGLAILFESGEHDSYWTVILKTGAFVTFTQDKIRAVKSYTAQRGISDEEMRKIVGTDDASR